MQEGGEDSLAINLDGAIWVPYKELFAIISSAVYDKDESRIQDLESTLRTYRMDFHRLLKNPPKRAQSRDVVKRAVTDGIRIQGQQEVRVLSQSVVNEALLLSDLFDLNEVVSLELLLTGESQQPRLSYLPRGLAAVLLYYDGRRCLVNSLRALIQARKGRCWTLELAPEVTDLATKITDDLWNEGLRNDLFNNLVSFNPTREYERLESSLALGNAKHRKQIVDLIEEIHVSLAECVYCWSCQTGLATADVLRLISVLSDIVPDCSDGTLDSTQFTLIMALFYSFDYEAVRSSDEFSEILDSISANPLLADHDFVSAVHKELMSQNQWKWPALKAAIQFAWAISLRNLSLLPFAQDARQQYDDEEEVVLDLAMEGGALCFLRDAIVGNPRFFTEEFFARRIHGLVTDFVVNFPLKVKEMRNCSDELARVIAHREWQQDDTTPARFKNLLELIAAIYIQDPFNLDLASEFWCPPDTPSIDPTSTFYPTKKQVNLYKFVRLSGDLLPPMLYVPYIDMLNGLSMSSTGARQCFNLLKANGVSGLVGSGGSLGRHHHHSIVSWDHFFTSLMRYLNSLRQEQPMSAAHAQRSMSPQELDGVCAFLRLVETIVSNDDLARHALAESIDWNPLPIFVGIIGCGVHVTLKAQLMLNLAAFAKSTEASVAIWNALETTRILPSSSGSSSTLSEFHIIAELDEVESRNEEYPLTRAFIKLLTVIVNSISHLDAWQMASRFDACVLFVINDVFSKFRSRAYKSIGEMWQVACDCLEFLLKLMTSCDSGASLVRPTSGAPSSIVNVRHAKPMGGDLVLSYMLQDSRLFRTVMYVIDESLKIFTAYTSVGKATLEQCSLLALKIVHTALEGQLAFMEALRATNSDLVVTGLEELLVSINKQSDKADFPTIIAKFTIFNETLPEHAFFAVSILSWLSRTPSFQDPIISAFLQNQDDTKDLRQGFVECLEADDNDGDLPDDVDWTLPSSNDSSSEARIRSSTRRSILRLFVTTVNFPSPNLALFFMGHDLYRPSLRTILQDPGVLGSPYTCLHAVIEILFRPNVNGLSVTKELCQHLVYACCANPDTSTPTLRYLRSSHDFLYRQLTIDAARLKEKTSDLSILNNQSWLVKTVAIEVRHLSASGQNSSLERLTETLLSETGKGRKTAGEDGATNLDAPVSSLGISTSRSLLLSILEQLDFSQTFPNSPQWEYFDVAVMEQAIVHCQRLTADGYLAVDVSRLHRYLLKEVANLHGPGSAGQRPLIAEEIRSVLQYVVSRNQFRRSLHAKRLALDAWRLLTETVLVAVPVDAVHDIPIILELVHTLLHKILAESALPELTQRVSGVLLNLIARLRYCFIVGPAGTAIGDKSAHSSSTTNQSSKRNPIAWASFASSLEAMLGGLLECIIQAGSGPSKLRADYYSALLNFLRLTDEPSAPNALAAEDLRHKFTSKCIEIINSYGDGIYEIFCRDASNTNDITKLLSLCCLSVLVQKDSCDLLFRFITLRGYLADYIDGLRTDDAQLQTILTSQNSDLRGLFIYETKMTFFLHLALSVKGAQLLISNGLLEALGKMRSLSMKPEGLRGSSNDEEDSLARTTGYYFQILVPALKVSLLLIASPISSVLQAKSKVVNLLVNHLDCFADLLREASNYRSRANEYALVTTFIAHSLSDVTGIDESMAEIHTELSRLRRLVQAILPALIELRRSSANKRPTGLRGVEISDQPGSDVLSWANTVDSVLSFCVSVAQSGSEGVPVLTFEANLFPEESSLYGMVGNLRSLPDLGLLVFLVKYCTEEILKAAQRSSFGLESMQGSSLANPKDISSQTQALFICIVERALYLLYFHLTFYIVQSSTFIRKTQTGIDAQSGMQTSRLRRLQVFPDVYNTRGDYDDTAPAASIDRPATASNRTFPLAREDIASLQNACHRCITDNLLGNVLKVSESSTSIHKGRFMAVMVRRLRWILSLPLS